MLERVARYKSHREPTVITGLVYKTHVEVQWTSLSTARLQNLSQSVTCKKIYPHETIRLKGAIDRHGGMPAGIETAEIRRGRLCCFGIGYWTGTWLSPAGFARHCWEVACFMKKAHCELDICSSTQMIVALFAACLIWTYELAGVDRDWGNSEPDRAGKSPGASSKIMKT